MRRKINREGKIFTDTVIIVIVLIITFVILLFFLFRISWQPVIDKQACHQSVVYRSSAKLGPLQASTKGIPLKCQTEKICFSMSGSDCMDISSTKNSPVKKVTLSKDIIKAKEEIKDTLAESMRECHWMLGEGQLDFMPKDFKQKNYGLICTRFVFDEESKKNIESIGYPELYAHLEKKTLRNGKSYLEYIYPGWEKSQDSLQLFEAFKQQINENEELRNDYGNLNPVDWKINLNNERGYVIVAQIAPEGNLASWAAAFGVGGAIPLGAGLIATGIGAPLGFTILGLSGAAGVISGGAVLYYSYPEKYDYAPPAIYEFDVDVLKNIGIYSFEIAPTD